jgi:hypothetical protein
MAVMVTEALSHLIKPLLDDDYIILPHESTDMEQMLQYILL